MRETDSTQWWRESAAGFGPMILDTSLRGATEWSAALASGQDEVRRILAKTQLRTGPEVNLLEIGCGTGRLTLALGEYCGSVLGIDVSQEFISIAERNNHRKNVHFALADGKTISPNLSISWDVVFSYEVFHYLELKTIVQYFQDAYRLLKPGGQFIFQINTSPIRISTRIAGIVRAVFHMCGKRMWRNLPTAPRSWRKYRSLAFLKRSLSDTGFVVEQSLLESPNQTWIVTRKPDTGSECG
jgi:SAM-dependent methyltransferase